MLALATLCVVLWPARFASAQENDLPGAASDQVVAQATSSQDFISIPQTALSTTVAALLEQKNFDAVIAAIEAGLAQAEIRSAPRRYKADLYLSLGHAYLSITRFEEARRHLLFANFLFHGLLDEEPLLEAVLLGDLGKAYAGEEPYTTSANYFRQAITLLSRTPDKEHLFLMSHLACNLARQYESWQLAEAVVTLKQRCLNAFRLSAMRQVPRQQQAIMSALDALPPAWVPRHDGHDYLADPVASQAAVLPSVGPVYPAEALRQGHEGFVMLRAVLDEHGKLLELAVASSSGYENLDQAALQAAQQWRYEAAVTREGKAVASSLDLPFGFIAEETF